MARIKTPPHPAKYYEKFGTRRPTMRMILIVTALAMMLAACSEQKKDVKDTVFGSQLQMKDKARAVENTLRQGAEKEREAIESSEKPGEPEQK
jgi:hypothetical protein